MLRVEWAGERVVLHAQRALSWPRRRTAIVADLHFGKDAAFRGAGVPVPAGTTGANLRQLDALLEECRVERLVILGDLLHARAGRSDEVMGGIGAWRDAHRDLEITLVRGNHDRRAGDPPPEWAFECADELAEPPFLFVHDPDETSCGDGSVVVAGHVHPMIDLDDGAGTSLRCPCFVLGEQRGLLPPFGGFTGGRSIRPARGDRIFAVGPGDVIALRDAPPPLRAPAPRPGAGAGRPGGRPRPR